MLVEKKTHEGDVARDIYGPWDDCKPGVYIDSDRIDTIASEFIGKRVRITIEVIDSENAESEVSE